MQANNYRRELLEIIKSARQPMTFMEVCGTHTVAIARSGLRELAPKQMKLLSGPGCPVCVTAQRDIDALLQMVRDNRVILATFGDMIRVPGTYGSLEKERGRGADIRVVYSPLEAIELSRSYPEREVVFLGVGFETTIPAVAVCVETARRENLKNFSLFSLHKVVAPALAWICSDPDIKVDGLICPGHVAIVTGIEPFSHIADVYKIPCVITGFTTLDILEGLVRLIYQIQRHKAETEIQYNRVVKAEGNLLARQIIDRVFKPAPTAWRGIGVLNDSGLVLRDEYQEWDAHKKFNVREMDDIIIKGCACGEVLTAKKTPPDCLLFGRACTPVNPIGPCMVSQEGACAAYYRYATHSDNMPNAEC